MALTTPWMTTQKIIQSIKRRISFPSDQSTFTDDDITQFVNEELMISQVPSVMQYHENFYVYKVQVPILPNTQRYPIPNRAIGMKLRDLMWEDEQGNLYEMSQVQDGDKAYFQSNVGSNAVIQKFYLEGNSIVLTPEIETNPTGFLNFYIFIRPNQLVDDSRAAIIDFFVKKVTVDNATISPGDTLIIKNVTFTAVSGAPGLNEFQIGVSSVVTATNLAASVNMNGIAIANNGSPSTSTVLLKFTDRNDPIDNVYTSSLGLILSPNYTIEFESVPSNITEGMKIDFLQTEPGHSIYNYDVLLTPTAIAGNFIDFDPDDIPEHLQLDDYICLANECIIPFLPPEFQNVLAERACARILSAIGDQQGLSAITMKIQEMEKHQATMITNRVENAPQKVLNRTSLLRFSRMGWRRRF